MINLITTGLPETSKGNQNEIFLGDWCIPITDKFNKNKNFKIVPYHWENTDIMKKDMNNLYQIYKQFLPIMKDYLNKFHKIKNSVDYWEFLIGPWLFMFLNILYDRYLSIETASKKYPNFHSSITDQKITPQDFNQTYELITTHQYNFVLYSQIISEFPGLKKKKIRINLKTRKNLTTSNFTLKKLIVQTINYIKNLKKNKNSRTNNYIELISSDFSPKDQKIFFDNLNLNFNEINLKKFKVPQKQANVRPEITEDFDDNFLSIAKKIIPDHIPIDYMENFNDWKNLANNSGFADNPKTVIMRSPGEFISLVRFYCAEKKNKGAKLVGMQHGGGYGVQPYASSTELETDLVDLYLTWGWEPKIKNEKVKRFFTSKTYWIKKYDYNKNGKIILINSGLRNYFIHPFNQPPSFNKVYLNLIKNFINKLNQQNQKEILNRFHFNFGYGEEELFKRDLKHIKISSRNESSHLYDLLFKSKLAIVTTNLTSFLQTFMINHPTILLWPKEFNSIKPEFDHYYKELENAGILYFNSEDCAAKVNSISNDPIKWWSNEKVQKAKNHFCENFSKFSSNFGNELTQTLKKKNFA